MKDLSSYDDQFLGKINQIITEHLSDEDFSVKELAKNIGLSRSMLHRKLIKLCGKSASELIKEIKLEQAKTLLEKNAATVSEIAYQVGFRSPSYFNKVFKQHYNISPGDVKKGATIPADRIKTVKGKTRFSTILSNKKLLQITILLLLIIAISTVAFYKFGNIFQKKSSIAVLPLHNLTGHTENDYFVDGMHDALISELGQFSSLRVISRTSTLRYRNNDMLLSDIAGELGVRNIIEGSVIGVGDSIRILIQLIDVFPKEKHLLAKEYKDDISNVLCVQTSAIQDIAKEINIELSEKEIKQLAKTRKVNPVTYKAYLSGMYYLNQGTSESFEKGIRCLHEAIEEDPGDPLAYAGLAIGYSIKGHGQLNSEEAFRVAMSSAQKAIKLDPTIDEAYNALSILYLYQVWDWQKAKEAFGNTIRNNPNNAIAHAHYAWYHILFNDMEKSIYHAKQAVLLEPFSASYTAWLAALYCHNNEYNKAESWAKKALELKENSPYGNLILGWVNLHRKNYEKAIYYHEKLPQEGCYWNTFRAHAYVKAGKREKALALWDKFSKKKNVNSCHLGMMAASLDFKDIAFELLNDACKNKTYPISYINFYPCTENLRKDSRYNTLLHKLNLPRINNQLTSHN